jgi:hypothetical protein
MAVEGCASRDASDPEKCTSPAKAMVTGFDGSGAVVVAVPVEVGDGGAVSGGSLARGREEDAAEAVPGASAPFGSCPEPPVHPTRRASDARPARARGTDRLDGLTHSTLERIDQTRHSAEARRAYA